jgi:uridine nucleosidase
MGGSTGLGNTSPAAEFNIEVDPEAAALVLASARAGAFEAEAALLNDARAADSTPLSSSSSPAAIGLESAKAPDCVPVVMVPLDVTHTALFTPEHREQLSRLREVRGAAPEGWRWREPHQDVPAMADGLFQFFASTYKTLFGFHDGPPVHDPCAVLCACRPDLFDVRWCRTIVETTGVCTGRTVVDVLGVMGPPVPQGREESSAELPGAVTGAETVASASSEMAVGAASFKGASGLWAKAPVVGVALSMDVDAFWGEMLEALRHMDSVSPLSLERE